MLGLDTSILVRLLISDDSCADAPGAKLVRQAIDREEPVLVSMPVLMEAEWALRSRHELSREAISRMFRTGLETRELSFEDEPAVEEALCRWKDSVCGFADCPIVAHNRRLGCRAAATFVDKAARLPGTMSA